MPARLDGRRVGLSLEAARTLCEVTGIDYVPELIEMVRTNRVNPAAVITGALPA